MRFEVVIGGEHFRADEFFLEDGHEVEQVFGVVVSDVVDLVGRERQSVFAVLLFGGMLHHAHNAFDDVIDVGEVALAFAVVENLDGLAGFKLVGEAEVSHVRAAGGAVDGKEAQSRAWDVVELAVGMRHEFVTLLGGGIQRYGVVHFIVGGVGNFLVTAVHAGGTCVDEVFEFAIACSLAACFEDVVEPDEIALDVSVGVCDGIAYAGLGGEVHDDGKVVLFEQAVDGCLISEVRFDEGPFFASRVCDGVDFLEALVLDVDVIVVGYGIESDEFGASVVVQQLLTEVASDKARGSCYKDCFPI